MTSMWTSTTNGPKKRTKSCTRCIALHQTCDRAVECKRCIAFTVDKLCLPKSYASLCCIYEEDAAVQKASAKKECDTSLTTLRMAVRSFTDQLRQYRTDLGAAHREIELLKRKLTPKQTGFDNARLRRGADASRPAQLDAAAIATFKRMRNEDIEKIKSLGFFPETEDYGDWPKGGQGTVLICTHNKGRLKYCIKMPLEFKQSKVELMEQEFEMLSLLIGSPHTIKLATISSQSAALRLPHGIGVVLNFIDFVGLNEIEGQDGSGRDRVSVWEAVGLRRCLVCLAKAVQHLHERGIVHGDVKVSNVLIHRSLLELSLSDFGMACRSKVGFRHNATPGYRSPETLGTENTLTGQAAKNSDIWAVGVVSLCFIVRSHFLFSSTDCDAFTEQEIKLGARAAEFSAVLEAAKELAGGGVADGTNGRRKTARAAGGLLGCGEPAQEDFGGGEGGAGGGAGVEGALGALGGSAAGAQGGGAAGEGGGVQEGGGGGRFSGCIGCGSESRTGAQLQPQALLPRHDVTPVRIWTREAALKHHQKATDTPFSACLLLSANPVWHWAAYWALRSAPNDRKDALRQFL